MKNFWKSLMIVLVSVFALASCEDVPAPYPNPDNGENGGGNTNEEVAPAGEGTLENPYNVAGVLAYIEGLGADVESSTAVYVKGKVLSNNTSEATITQYGNMTFDIIDEGNTSKTFKAFQVYGPGNKKFTAVDQIKEGDEVIVYGKVVNYKGNTPETVGKGQAYVVSINDNGNAGGDTPGEEATAITCAKAMEICAALADGATSTETYSITGYITDVFADINYNQQSFWMSDNNDGQKMVQAYWANLPGGVSAFTVKSKVKITGKLLKFVKNGEVITEVKNADVEILEQGGDTPDTPSGDIKHITIAEFLSKADTENAYELTGTVRNISNTTYGNFDLVEGDASIYIYGLLDKDGNTKNFASLGISEGDEVTLTGVYLLYNDKPEIKNAQFVSVKKAEGGNETPDTPGEGEVSSLQNGGFENWVNDSEPTGWKSASTASSASLSKSTDAHSGDFAVSVTGVASSNKRLATKELTLEAGSYKFSFYAKSTKSDKCQTRPGYVPVTNGSVGNYNYGDYTNLKSSGWTLVEYEFTLDTTTTVCLVIMNPKNSSYSETQDILVDDATLVKK